MANKKPWSQEAYKQIIIHAWKDKAFKEKLLANPKAALDEMGIELPQELKVKARELPKNTLEIVIPPAPVNAEKLSEPELLHVGAAACFLKYFTCNFLSF